MKSITHILLIVALSLTSQFSWAQEVGIEAVINPQTESFGAGIRAQLPISYFTFAPQIAYYPSFNKVSELYLGASLHLNVTSTSRARYYILANGSYNSWLNYTESPMKNAKQANWGLEFGGGIQGSNCISPFAEYRYNLKWHETNIRIGVLLNLSCKGNGKAKGYNSGYKERKAVNCPGH